MTVTLETTAKPSTTSNSNLAEAFAELAGLITNRPHLPAVKNGTFILHGARPDIDLWFAQAEHVAAWAEDFGADVTKDVVDDVSEPFTLIEAAVPDRYCARLRLVHFRRHERPAVL